MPFVKGNTIGAETRFKTGQSGNPAGRPPDKLRRFINAELDKIEREATGKQAAATKLEVLAERIVEDAVAGCIPSRKMLVDRLYPALNRHELATADGEAINLRWENQIREAAAELDRILGIERPPLVDA
jgi:hypothetical protein